ncbi:MAG: redox-regulated ATPase YchF [Bacillota bacterium]
MQIGLVGLPLTGKTTFFNLLTGAAEETGLSGKREVYTGTAAVPDERIDFLARIYRPKKIFYAQIQFKDIPGVHRGDGAGTTSRLLEEVRAADALVQVVRAFKEDMVDTAVGEPDPYSELTDFGVDLALADMVAVENRLNRLQGTRKPPKDALAQASVLQRVLNALENGQRLKEIELTDQERSLLADQNFLTEKPLIIVVNLDEEYWTAGDFPGRAKILAYGTEHQIPVMEICARIELEINQLPAEDRVEFMKDLHLNEPGINRLARAAYSLLGLISFFTIGADEVRAWTIRQGTEARKAAGKVHSDMERGFIRAEVFHWDDLKSTGSAAAAREKGLFRLEGKEYVVRDGDIINFRFNV